MLAAADAFHDTAHLAPWRPISPRACSRLVQKISGFVQKIAGYYVSQTADSKVNRAHTRCVGFVLQDQVSPRGTRGSLPNTGLDMRTLSKIKLFGLLAGISIYALAVQPAAADSITLDLTTAVFTGGAGTIAGGSKIKFDPNTPGETATFTLSSVPGTQV
jgi:hypothetical protein